jgi:ABC-type phosphate transport system substrate-binding protein
MSGITRRSLLIAMIVLGAASGSIAGEDSYRVIVHPDNPVTSIDKDFLRDVYLKKATEWSSGETIRPIDLSAKFHVRDVFTHEILHKTPSQLKNYWNQQIFSGKNVPPIEAESTTDVINYVLENPGAVGYLPADVDPGRAKVVKVN